MLGGALAALLLLGSGASRAAPVSVTLCAMPGATVATTPPAPAAALPVGTKLWSYVLDPAGTCSGMTAPTLPGGPTISVTAGDVVTVTLFNNLPVATSLQVQGQAMSFDATGVPAAGSKAYTFTATQPGTYLYEAGPLLGTEYQAAMGLYGAFVVNPTTTGRAYDDAATIYDDSAVLVLSELDPALSNSVTPANFDMRKFAPKYFLINGKPYPNTDAINSTATSTLGKKLLLRYLNAGAKHHSMSVLGLRQVFVAKDGNPLPQLNHDVVAETLAPGQTADAILSVPAVSTATKYPVYDAGLALHNNGSSTAFGGMLAFIGAGTGASTDGPVVTAMSYAAAANTLTATIQATSPRTVTGAEYWFDAGAHTAIATTGTVSQTLSGAPTSTGTHVLYLRGQDDLGTKGATRSVSFAIDTTGPTITALTLTPNADGSVALQGSADDSASGGANVMAAQYSVDGGAMVAATLGGAAAPVRSVTATTVILTPGSHTIALQAQDALGNWGAPRSAPVSVGTPPNVTSVTVAKSPNNGTLPLSVSQQVVRVTAALSGLSSIAGAEGFVDVNTGAVGTGFPFIASDGAWGGLTETAYADIPLNQVATLGNGSHTIYVRGRNAAGNWGGFATGTLVIDKTLPTISAATLTPSTIAFGAASTTLAITAADNLGVAAAQYWIDGSTTPPANPIAIAPTGGSIGTATLPVGVHTIYVRVQDAASNWSTVASAALTVAPVPAADTKTISANGNATQVTNYAANVGLLVNDVPNVAGRTVRLASAPVRLTGTGTGTMTVTCQGGGGNTAATPAIGGNTVCTNGAFRITLNGVGGNNAARTASKLGSFSFTYTETLNGVTSAPATVTITVQ